jgi:hypothetical protein
MEFLQRLFGRDIYNLICDYCHPISELAMKRKEYMNVIFTACSKHNKFRQINYDRHSWYQSGYNSINSQWSLRNYWIDKIRDMDAFMIATDKLKLRSRNKGISDVWLSNIYGVDIDRIRSYGDDFYKHYEISLTKQYNNMMEIRDDSNYGLGITI